MLQGSIYSIIRLMVPSERHSLGYVLPCVGMVVASERQVMTLLCLKIILDTSAPLSRSWI